ncbi:MAG: hypothetical protein CL928_00535 [Deltaproteobacteria bacterium]|nr:hypothetical protein [Deltaproteobacteria bacterium]
MHPSLVCRASRLFVQLAVASLFVSSLGCQDSEGGLAASLTAVVTADPVQVYLGDVVRFDGGESTDTHGIAARFSDTVIDGFAFDFGDGSTLDSEVFYAEHVYAEAGEFSATLTVWEGDTSHEDSVTVVVRHPPPSIVEVDVSGDDVAVIGEWIELVGRAFRAENLPEVRFDAVVATQVEFQSEFLIRVQVPPMTASGWSDLAVDFPDDIEGDGQFQIWVARYALATDAWRGAVYLVEFGDDDQYWSRTQTLEVDNAAVVRVSGDGSFALVGDARYTATLEPSVTVVNLTADWQPVVTAELDGLGYGPLFDIAIARDIPRAVVTDATGFVVLDLTDPANPVRVGDREAYDFGDMAPTAIALSPDGARLAVLSTFNDRVRFYSITDTGPIYESWSVDVGPGTQDLAVFDDANTLAVLGGGGEGAIPPDFGLDNTSLTVVDMAASIPSNLHGTGAFLDFSGSAPVPIDLAVGATGRSYVSSLDSNFGDVLDAFGDLATDPFDIGAWQDVVESIMELGFGSVIQASGALDGALFMEQSLFSSFGFQAGLDVRYDEHLYVATVLGLGTTLEIFTDDDWINLSLDIDYGVAVGNLLTGGVEVFDMYTEPVVSFNDGVWNLNFDPLTALLLPPYAFGDVAIQP